MFKKIKNERLYLQIVNQIRNLIISGKLKVGEKNLVLVEHLFERQ